MNISAICQACGGRCCQGPIFLRAREMETFGEEKKARFLEHAQVLTAGSTYVLPKTCPYLEGGRCAVWHEGRPFDCTIFPLSFDLVEGELHWHMAPCPLGEAILAGTAEDAGAWLDKTKRLIIDQVRTWTPTERADYEGLSSPWSPRGCGVG